MVSIMSQLGVVERLPLISTVSSLKMLFKLYTHTLRLLIIVGNQLDFAKNAQQVGLL